MGLLTRLLYEMDGLEDQPLWILCLKDVRAFFGFPPIDPGTIMVIGSTNIEEVLDLALTRPGRFDRKLHIGLPDKESRKEIIEGYVGQIKHDESINIDNLVQDTVWATPAQIMAAITKDAVRLAIFRGRDYVTQRDIEDAFQEQALGVQNPISDLDPEQKRQVAVHEASHAIVQHYLEGDKKRIVRVSIIRRSNALGYVLPALKLDIYTMRLDTFVRDIMVSLAGHVGTRLVLGEYWTGAGADLIMVKARINVLAQHGFFGGLPEYSDNEMGKVINNFLEECMEKTEMLLVKHRDVLDALVEELLEKEDLSGDEVVRIIEGAEVARD